MAEAFDPLVQGLVEAISFEDDLPSLQAKTLKDFSAEFRQLESARRNEVGIQLVIFCGRLNKAQPDDASKVVEQLLFLIEQLAAAPDSANRRVDADHVRQAQRRLGVTPSSSAIPQTVDQRLSLLALRLRKDK